MIQSFDGKDHIRILCRRSKVVKNDVNSKRQENHNKCFFGEFLSPNNQEKNMLKIESRLPESSPSVFFISSLYITIIKVVPHSCLQLSFYLIRRKFMLFCFKEMICSWRKYLEKPKIKDKVIFTDVYCLHPWLYSWDFTRNMYQLANIFL